MKGRKGPWSLPIWRIQTDWEVHHLHMLLQQPSLCCQTQLRFISKCPSTNLISGRTYRIKYISLAFIGCQKASKGQWMTAKLIISFSEWRSVSVTSAWLVLAYIFMCNVLLIQRSQKLTEWTRSHWSPLLPQTYRHIISLLIQWDFFKKNDRLKELHRSKLLWFWFLFFSPLCLKMQI